MRHLRRDYDGIQPWPVKRPHVAKLNGYLIVGQQAENAIEDDLPIEPLIPDDEPVFLLRGQDPAAAKAVRAYIRYAAAIGVDEETLAALDTWAEEMADYAERAQHGPADVPAGMLRVG